MAMFTRKCSVNKLSFEIALHFLSVYRLGIISNLVDYLLLVYD